MVPLGPTPQSPLNQTPVTIFSGSSFAAKRRRGSVYPSWGVRVVLLTEFLLSAGARASAGSPDDWNPSRQELVVQQDAGVSEEFSLLFLQLLVPSAALSKGRACLAEPPPPPDFYPSRIRTSAEQHKPMQLTENKCSIPFPGGGKMRRDPGTATPLQSVSCPVVSLLHRGAGFKHRWGLVVWAPGVLQPQHNQQICLIGLLAPPCGHFLLLQRENHVSGPTGHRNVPGLLRKEYCVL